MADGTLQYQNPTTVDELLDTETLAVGLNTVHRERIQVTGTGATDIAPVSAADGLLVNLGANNDVTGTVTANAGTNLNTSLLALEAGGNLAAAATSLAIIDDWDESDRAKINSIVGQAGIQGGAGTVSANTTRVAIATDANVISGTVTANAGTNLNTSLLALEAGGNLAAAAASLSVLDDWDETNRAAVNTIAGQVGIQGGAGTVTALTTRVAIATDANAISGTVTANAGTNLNTSALNLEATQTSVLTSVQIIDNIVGAHGSAAGSGVAQVGFEGRTTLPTVVTDGQAVRSMADDIGRTVNLPFSPRELQVTHALTLSGSTEATLLGSGGSGIYHDLTMVTVANTLSSNATITFRSATAGAPRFYMYSPGQQTVGFVASTPVVQTTAANNWTAQADHGAGGLQIFVQAVKAK